MTTASNWLLNWAIAYSTPYMVDEKYANLKSKVFFVWGSCCFVCIAFVYFFIYETKGLTLEEVDELYGIVGKAWQSKKFRPAVKFADVEKEGIRGGRESLADYARRRSSVTQQGAGLGANGTTPATTADAPAVGHEKPGVVHHNGEVESENV